jgi:hypothetical protein
MIIIYEEVAYEEIVINEETLNVVVEWRLFALFLCERFLGHQLTTLLSTWRNLNKVASSSWSLLRYAIS